jgi:hypothetical protein
MHNITKFSSIVGYIKYVLKSLVADKVHFSVKITKECRL